MVTKDSIETAYCFIHQKLNIYSRSTLDWQRDDIEYAISSFTEEMNQELYLLLANGRKDFLRSHDTFLSDMQKAQDWLESRL